MSLTKSHLSASLHTPSPSLTPSGLHYAYVGFRCVGEGVRDVGALRRYVHLQDVRLDHNPLQSLTPLHALHSLKSLSLTHCTLNSQHLENFIFPTLSELDVSCNHLDSLSDIPQNKYLTSLSIAVNRLKSLSHLSNLLYLRHLDAHSNQLSSLKDISNSNLVELNVAANFIQSIEDLAPLQCLQTLNLSSNPHLKSLSGIENLPHLITLYASETGIDSMHEIERLRANRYLRSLDLRQTPLSQTPTYIPTLLHLLPSLTILDGNHVTMEECVESLRVNGRFGRMEEGVRKVFLLDDQTVDPDSPLLSQSTSTLPPQSFYTLLGERGFLSEWHAFMTRLSVVSDGDGEKLDLTGCMLGETGLYALSRSLPSSLKTLILNESFNPHRWTSILSGGYGWKALGCALKLSNVQAISIRSCYLDRFSGLVLANYIENNSIIQSLDVSYNILGQHESTTIDRECIVVTPCPALEALCRACLSASNLTSLNLRSNSIDASCARTISNYISASTCKVRELDLSMNPIGDGARLIVQALRENGSILSLIWQGSGESEPSSVNLSSSMWNEFKTMMCKYNRSITSIDFAHQRALFQNDDGSTLASILIGNTGRNLYTPILKSLNLHDTGLHDEVLGSISTGLESNMSLEYIDLSNNALSSASRTRLFTSLRAHPSLTSLHITVHEWSSEEIIALGEWVRTSCVVEQIVCERASGTERGRGCVSALAVASLSESIQIATSQRLHTCTLHNLEADLTPLFPSVFTGNLSSLKDLDLSGSRWNDENWGLLCQHLASSPISIESINLSRSIVPHVRGDYAPIAHLLSAIVAGNCIRCVCLAHIPIGWDALTEGLHNNASITAIDVSHCALSDLQSEKFEWLKSDTVLESLNLSGNTMTGEEIQALSELLLHNTSLTHLDLSQISLDSRPDSFFSLCTILSCARRLKKLALPVVRGVDARDELIDSICQGLQQSRGKLDLENLEISIDSDDALYGDGTAEIALSREQKQALLMAFTRGKVEFLSHVRVNDKRLGVSIGSGAKSTCDDDFIDNALGALFATNRVRANTRERQTCSRGGGQESFMEDATQSE